MAVYNRNNTIAVDRYSLVIHRDALTPDTLAHLFSGYFLDVSQLLDPSRSEHSAAETYSIVKITAELA